VKPFSVLWICCASLALGQEDSPPPLAGSLSARVAFGFGHFGSDVGFEFSPFGVSNQVGHLSLRFTPKAHIEASASIGYRRNVLGHQVREGLDIGVPNE
jgi:hypothetical protein